MSSLARFHITLTTIAWLLCPGLNPSTQAQSTAKVSSTGGSQTSTHQITVPGVTSAGLGLFWTVNPPTIEIQGLIQKNLPAGVIKKTMVPNNQAKFDVSTAAGGGVALSGKNDLQRIDENSAGIFATATGRWNTQATTIPGTGVIQLFTSMETGARINALDPPPKFSADAAAQVLDPLTFPALAAGENLLLETTLHAGQTLQGLGDGVGGKKVFVGSDFPGYEMLYELNMETMQDKGTPALSVDFRSHPQLGLDDAAIAAAVFNSFAYDAAEEHFSLGDDLTLFNGSLPLPTGQAFNLYLDESASARAGLPIDDPSLPGQKTVILSPTAVIDTDLGVFSAETPLENIINQSGLDKAFQSGETDFDAYFNDGTRPFAQADYRNNWQSEVAFDLPLSGSLDLDLGEVYSLDRVAIWNRSLENVTLLVAESPEGPWQEAGGFTLQNRLSANFSYDVEILDLDANYEAQYLRLRVDSVYPFSPGDTFAYAAIGEVAVGVLTELPLLGDFNGNRLLDADDMDWLSAEVRDAGAELIFDVNFDGAVNDSDRDVWLKDLVNTYVGDANLDGEFNSSDLIDVLAAGTYEIDIPAGWSTGDFDGNGRFDTGDLVAALADGGYEQGPRAAASAVPEPSALLPVTIVLLGVPVRRQASFREAKR